MLNSSFSFKSLPPRKHKQKYHPQTFPTTISVSKTWLCVPNYLPTSVSVNLDANYKIMYSWDINNGLMVCRPRIIAGLFFFVFCFFLLLTAQQHLANRNQDFISENFTLESICTKSISYPSVAYSSSHLKVAFAFSFVTNEGESQCRIDAIIF